jgi:hypothetical protein
MPGMLPSTRPATRCTGTEAPDIPGFGRPVIKSGYMGVLGVIGPIDGLARLAEICAALPPPARAFFVAIDRLALTN